MAGLQVLSAPTNQPTLNPRVQSAPVQPTLALGVVAQPVQPSLAPRVVTQPQQPALAPKVITQAPLPQINVDNSPRFTKLGQAVKAKFPGVYDNYDDGALGKVVAAKYPGVYDKLIDLATPAETPQAGAKGLGGFLLGAAKGVGNTLNTISQFGQKALQTISPVKVPTASISKERLTPQGTAEKIGYGAEQVGEFFIPGGAVSKVGKAAEAGVDALKLGSKATGLLKLGAKTAISAGEAAGITALQGGTKGEVKTAAVLGGAFGVVSKGVEKLLQKTPETAWSAILKRTPTEAAKNPNLPAQAAKTGLAGTSRASILEKSKQAIQNIEVALDDVLSQTKEKIGTLKIAPYLDELRNAYKNVPGEQASLDAIDNVMKDLLKKKSLTLVEANELKRNIYGAISKSYGKGLLELPAKTEAQKLIAAGLKREIEKVVPEVKSLNEQQAVYIQVKKAIEKTLARTEGKGIAGTGIGLYDLLVGGIGTVGGAATGNPLLGLGLVAAKKTGESTAVLSSTSKLINYFNELSPTKKLLFYNALKGLTVKGGVGIANLASPQTAK